MLRSPNGDKKASSLTDLTKTETLIPSRKRKTNPGSQEIAELFSFIAAMKEEQDKKFDAISGGIEEVRSQNQMILNTQDKLEQICESSMALHAETKTKLEKLSKEHDEALVKIYTMEDQLEEVHRTLRAKCLEIVNIPDSETEDLKIIVGKVHNSLGIKFEPGTVSSIHRNKKSKGKPVVVEYHSQQARNEVLKAAKSYNKANQTNKLNTHTLGLSDKRESLYINELLTPKARQLFYHARLQIKNDYIKYCWINNGRVFIKKSEGDTATHIKSVSQLENFPSSTYPAI